MSFANARLLVALLAALVVVPACKRAKPPPPRERAIVSARMSEVLVVPEPPPLAIDGSNPPPGYALATVLGVASTRDSDSDGGIVVLEIAGGTVLPIFIGGTEALSIRLRLDGEKPSRPLTHDLLGSLVRELGGTPVRVQVDDLRGATFVGSVFVKQGERTIKIDARPSDAIAIALGSHAPIYAARAVLERAGLPRSSVEKVDADAKRKSRGLIEL